MLQGYLGVIGRFSHYFPLVIVGLLAGSSYWLEFIVRNERSTNAPTDRRAPDAYVENLALDRFDATGQHQFHLVAEKMTHYAINDTADFEQPRLLFKKNQKPLTYAVIRAWHESDAKFPWKEMFSESEKLYRVGLSAPKHRESHCFCR
ncbi:MAG: LPS export ABC transporter periplasmic protein LptC [Uliginosibacterium sp.]|nr:LPS export ABC transporter periplasmic protein LptC [Uliginosibacterium sp.]